jgi:hypothetical protein
MNFGMLNRLRFRKFTNEMKALNKQDPAVILSTSGRPSTEATDEILQSVAWALVASPVKQTRSQELLVQVSNEFR